MNYMICIRGRFPDLKTQVNIYDGCRCIHNEGKSGFVNIEDAKAHVRSQFEILANRAVAEVEAP